MVLRRKPCGTLPLLDITVVPDQEEFTRWALQQNSSVERKNKVPEMSEEQRDALRPALIGPTKNVSETPASKGPCSSGTLYQPSTRSSPKWGNGH